MPIIQIYVTDEEYSVFQKMSDELKKSAKDIFKNELQTK